MERYLYDGLSFEVLAELCEEGRTEQERSNRWAPSRRRSVTCEYQRAGVRLIGRSEYEREGRNRHRERVQKHYYLQDVLGSVVALSDERGHERQRCAYDAWGGEYERRGPGRNGNGHGHHLWQQGLHEGTGYGYTGKRLDRPAGLYDYGFRDYKPRISRWTTVDPIRDGRNWYSYVENDPVNRIDPLGLLSDEGNTSGSAEEPYYGRGSITGRDDMGTYNSNKNVSGARWDAAGDYYKETGNVENSNQEGSFGGHGATGSFEKTENSINEKSGWTTVAGCEMIAIGATLTVSGIVSVNAPITISGIIMSKAGSELAREGNIDKTVEKIDDIAGSIDTFINDLIEK